MRCYRLSFGGPFHLDSLGTGFYLQSQSFVHSDTLSAALLSAWALLEPAGAEARAAEPPFLISSAFPYFEELLFLPRPATSRAVVLADDALNRFSRFKEVKVAQWLSPDLWRRVAAGGDEMSRPEALALRPGGLALTPAEAARLPAQPLWLEEPRTRLTMSRGSGHHVDGLLFDFTRIWLQPGGGLYFLARVDAADRAGFEAALSLLGDSGLGADRAVGNGWFTWREGDPPPLASPDGAQPAIALSLVNPAPEERAAEGWLEGAAYDLKIRGGWVSGSTRRRAQSAMFTEGSVFPAPLTGCVLEVGPDGSGHQVFRDGRGFFAASGAPS